MAAVRRFQQFTGEYPWAWQPADVEEYSSDLFSGPRPCSEATVRNYQGALRLFGEFITDSRYAWAAECERRVGAVPVQVCHEWNTSAHLADYEGDADRRPLTRQELQDRKSVV